jgi:hypothetical protein
MKLLNWIGDHPILVCMIIILLTIAVTDIIKAFRG